jgi:glycosyltransferase involved in cell wall biosynthesis
MVSAVYRSADLVLASSRGFIPKIEQRGGPVGRIHHFPNWVEDVHATEANSQATLSADLPEGAFKLMFAGNIGRAQNFETIIAAAERLKEEANIHWLIVGDGRRREWVEQQVRDRALQKTVHVLGSYPPAAMPALFNQTDALLVTLGRDPLFALTAPGKLQSYLASGKLIVGALEGEGRRVLEDSGAAVLCSPEDPDALADAVITAYKMPASLRRSMGESGRRYCSEHFRREVLIDQLESWMREAVASYAPAQRGI